MRKPISFLALLAVFFFTSCVSSRTTEHRVSSVTEDSTSLSISDSARVVEVQNGAASTTLTDSTHLTADVCETDTNEETITEQITETYDIDGKKTINTNRTIQRKGNHAKQTQVDGSFFHQVQALKQYIDSLDREWGTHLDAQKKSLEKDDSTNNVSDKNTSYIKPKVGWGRARQILFVAVLFGLLIGAILYVERFKK
jgi:hypothetical protein